MVGRIAWGRFRAGVVTGSSGLLVLAVIGCSATGSTTATTGTVPRPTTASPSPSASPLDGATLYSLLLSPGVMPAGFRLDPSGTRNAEHALPQDSSQPVPESRVCGLLNGTSWIAAGGIAAADFAQNDYESASRTAEVAQEIDAFQPGNAEKAMSRLWQVFGHCRSFTVRAAGSTAAASLTRTRLAGVGDQAIKAVWTTPLFRGGTTLVAIRVGYAIVTFLDSSPSSNKGKAAVSMAERVAQRVRAAQQAG